MVLTSAIFLVLVIIELIGVEYNKDIDNNFFDLTTANVIRGICSIFVIMVHFPAQWTNKVQDMIGSFAFVAVTLFFMMSAYGLVISVNTKENYLKGFFRKRILVLLVPFFVSVAIKLLFGFNWRSGGVLFVCVLVLFYLVFYFVNRYVKWKYKNMIVVLFVFLYSFCGYLFIKNTAIQNLGFSWYYESLGFAYGILLAQFQDKLVLLAKDKYFLKISTLAVCSCICGILYLKFKTIYFYGEYVLKCLLGIVIIMFVIMLVTRFRLGNKLSVQLGKISFEVFLYHGLVIPLLEKYTCFSSGISISLTVLITVLLAFVMNKIDSLLVKMLKK